MLNVRKNRGTFSSAASVFDPRAWRIGLPLWPRNVRSGRRGRPENWLQTVENVDSAPGFLPIRAVSCAPCARKAVFETRSFGRSSGEAAGSSAAVPMAGGRPEISLQAIENIDSAPGFRRSEPSRAAPAPARRTWRRALSAAPRARPQGPPPPSRWPGVARRSRCKPLKTLISAPGILAVGAVSCGPGAGKASSEARSFRCSSAEAAGSSAAVPMAGGCPDILLQALENIDSVPGFCRSIRPCAPPALKRRLREARAFRGFSSKAAGSRPAVPPP